MQRLGDRWDCSSYEGITLLSIPEILLRRNGDHLLRHQRPEESIDTPRKPTGLFLTLRVTVKYPRNCGVECSQPTSTPRRRLIRYFALRDPGITGLITSLYTDTDNAVKRGGGLSSLFPVNSRLRQCCESVQFLQGLGNR